MHLWRTELSDGPNATRFDRASLVQVNSLS